MARTTTGSTGSWSPARRGIGWIAGSARAWSGGDASLLEVLGLAVDAVDVGGLAHDVARGEQARLDRVIGVVVAERPAAADDRQVPERAQVVLDGGDGLAVAEAVARVGIAAADREPADHLPRLDEAQLLAQLAHHQLAQRLVGAPPELVASLAEQLE